MEDKKITYEESRQLINTMVNKAKDAYNDNGVGAMLWGSVIAVCSLVRLSEIQFGYKLQFDIYLLTVAAIIPQIFINIKEKREPNTRSYGDHLIDYIWLAFGISIFLLIHVVNLTFAAWSPVSQEYNIPTVHASAFKFSEFVMPLFLILYGLYIFITGAACKFKPMFWGGIFCWLSSSITVLFMEREYRQVKMNTVVTNV